MLAGVERTGATREVKLWLFNYLIFMKSTGLQPLQDRMDYLPCLLYLRGAFCALACVCLRSDSLKHSGSLSSRIPLVEDSEFSTK